MEYSIIDSQMRGENREKLIEYAENAGYKFYTEMLHDWHKNKNMSSGEIAKKIYDEEGQQLTTQSGVYYILNRNGFFDKERRYHKSEEKEEKDGLCSCCRKAKIKPGFSKLCHDCWKGNGSNSHIGTSYFDDPISECSAGVAMHRNV